MSEPTSKCCPQCGAPMPDDAPRGLCPKCLLAGVMRETGAGAPVTTPLPKPAAPTVAQLAPCFPNLEILELIGQGGMGYVYKARQPQLDRLVALKILPTNLAVDPAFAERFSREGRLLAKLNHPNIVTVHDFGVAEAPSPAAEAGTIETDVNATDQADVPSVARLHYYLLMEFMDGVNLRQAMHAGRFTPEQALNVVPKVCEALQYAHDEGVLHRDIKPENILVDAKGRVKIADFGIAKMLGAGDPADITLTGAGSALGTPLYMAPEQIERPGQVDHRADIYSLGVVFYEMLTGELPIGRFAAPSKKTNVNEQIDAIVLRALEKERELRQQSATEIKTQVEGAGPQPSAPERHHGTVIRSAQAFLTSPAHLQTLGARVAHPFTTVGDLMLEPHRLVFEGTKRSVVVPLAVVKDVSVGQLEWWSALNHTMAILSVTYQDHGAERTLVLRPVGAWPESVIAGNAKVEGWAKAIREAVEAASGAPPAVTPAEQLPLPTAPRWIKYALILAAVMVVPSGFIGMEVLHKAKFHGYLEVTVLGFGGIAMSLIAALSVFLTMITFVITRRALERGNLYVLTAHGGRSGGSQLHGDSTHLAGGAAGPGLAFGLVMFFVLMFLLGGVFSTMVGESGMMLGGLCSGFLATLIGARVETHPPARAWLRGFSVFGALMALPAIVFGLFFLFQLMQERGGWNPNPAELVVVPLCWLGMITLPWAVIRLHRACAEAAAPPGATAGTVAGNPWPRRLFYLVVVMVLLPVSVLFLIAMAGVFYGFQQASQVHPVATEVELRQVYARKNLAVMEVAVLSADGALRLRPVYEGDALYAEELNATPAPPDAVLVVPTPYGKEPTPRNEFRASAMRNQRVAYRVAFAMKDARAAQQAVESIRYTFDRMRAAHPQVRGALFLFEINPGQPGEVRARLEFGRARHVKIVDASEATAVEGVSPIAMTAHVRVHEIAMTNVISRMKQEVPAGVGEPATAIFTNRVLMVRLDIGCEPSVKAIGLNHVGESLDPVFLAALEKPATGVISRPAPDTSQIAFQLSRRSEPTNNLATTVLFAMADEVAARAALEQLRPLVQRSLVRRLLPDPETGHLRLELFNVDSMEKGAYAVSLLFAPAKDAIPLPRPAATAAGERLLVGSWDPGMPLGSATVTYAVDGRFVVDVSFLLKKLSSTGRWWMEGDDLITRVEESSNPKEVGKTERVTVVTLTEDVLVIRSVQDDGRVTLNTLRRVRAMEAGKEEGE